MAQDLAFAADDHHPGLQLRAHHPADIPEVNHVAVVIVELVIDSS